MRQKVDSIYPLAFIVRRPFNIQCVRSAVFKLVLMLKYKLYLYLPSYTYRKTNNVYLTVMTMG